MAIASGSKDPQVTVVARKKLAVLDGANTLLSAKMAVGREFAASNVSRLHKKLL